MIFLYYFTAALMGFVVAALIRVEWRLRDHEWPYASALVPVIAGLLIGAPTAFNAAVLGITALIGGGVTLYLLRHDLHR